MSHSIPRLFASFLVFILKIDTCYEHCMLYGGLLNTENKWSSGMVWFVEASLTSKLHPRLRDQGLCKDHFQLDLFGMQISLLVLVASAWFWSGLF